MPWERKPVYGVGINDVYSDCFTHPQPKYYITWNKMLRRCYCSKWHQKRPTYINCSVYKEWIYLSNFREWFNENYIDGYELDKDLLFPGNKVYGPNTCLFIPHNINSLFIFGNGKRGKYPLGIHFDVRRDNTFQARCANGKGKQISKNFRNLTEAHFWYLEQKINIINKYLQEDHSKQIKTGLNRWKELLTYHIDNKIIFDPDNINFELEI